MKYYDNVYGYRVRYQTGSNRCLTLVNTVALVTQLFHKKELPHLSEGISP